MQTIVNIKGMDCGGCVDSVTKKLASIKGITDVSVSLEKANAVVDHDSSINKTVINTAIEELGFDVA